MTLTPQQRFAAFFLIGAILLFVVLYFFFPGVLKQFQLYPGPGSPFVHPP
jgi:hypothetical protein